MTSNVHEPTLGPITDDDVEKVARFLHKEMDPRVSIEIWTRMMRTPWAAQPPNHGFMLTEASGEVVGAFLALYADLEVRGETIPVCNITTWIVTAPYRPFARGLVTALLEQEGYHFTLMSIVKTLEHRFLESGFVPLHDGWSWGWLNLPWPFSGTPRRLETDNLEAVLSDADRKIYRDHKAFHGLHHLAVGDGAGAFGLVSYSAGFCFKKPAALLHHVSRGDLLLRNRSLLGRYFQKNHGAWITRVEARFLPSRPRFAFKVGKFTTPLFKSPTLQREDVSNLYSEIASFAFLKDEWI